MSGPTLQKIERKRALAACLWAIVSCWFLVFIGMATRQAGGGVFWLIVVGNGFSLYSICVAIHRAYWCDNVRAKSDKPYSITVKGIDA